MAVANQSNTMRREYDFNKAKRAGAIRLASQREQALS
jgi:hypothetical protein